MSTFFSDQVVQALGWALVHSLWQATLIAALLYLLLPRFRNARQKYWLAYGALLLVLTAAMTTFVWYRTSNGVAGGLVWETSETETTSPVAVAENVATPALGSAPAVVWQDVLAGWLEARYPYLVACWLFGFGFFGLRLAGGLYYVRRLRKRGLTALPPEWQACKRDFSERLGLRRMVRLMESALAPVPMAVGFLKPMVLFPVGLINQISPAEAEAILAHELAHLAHRDWLFNLLQACIESLFYHHPAVWWISGVIRTERENSCDDAAVALTGKPLAYAKALVQVQERAKPATALPVPALYWQGSGTLLRPRPLLLERVKRILHQPQSSSPTMEKLIATVLLMALLLFCGLRANQNNPIVQSALAQIPLNVFGTPASESALLATDSIPKGKKGTQKIVREDDKQRVEMELKDGNLTRLNIDGKEIPKDEFAQYSELTDDIREDVRPPYPPMPPGVAIAPMPPARVYLYGDAPGPLSPMTPMAPMAPMTPMAAMPPMAPRISTTKDKDGNILLKVERNGEPLELTIKDGAVWHEGRKLEEGETLDLMGLKNNGFFYWNDDEGNNMSFGRDHFRFYSDDEGDAVERKGWAKEDLERIREDAKRLSQEYREKWKMTEEARKEVEKNMRAAQKDMEKAQREMQRELRNNQEELRKAAVEMQQAQREIARAMDEERRSRNRNYNSDRSSPDAADLDEVFYQRLTKDGLVDNPKKYAFQLTAEKLTVNGKKQSDEMHKKYLELYQSTTGKKMVKGDSISYSVEEE